MRNATPRIKAPTLYECPVTPICAGRTTRSGAGVHEREATARHFVERFRQALQLAAPLVGVDA